LATVHPLIHAMQIVSVLGLKHYGSIILRDVYFYEMNLWFRSQIVL